jgi:hypothetical protein
MRFFGFGWDLKMAGVLFLRQKTSRKPVGHDHHFGDQQPPRTFTVHPVDQWVAFFIQPNGDFRQGDLKGALSQTNFSESGGNFVENA